MFMIDLAVVTLSRPAPAVNGKSALSEPQPPLGVEHDGEVDRLHGGGDVLLLLASSSGAVQVEQAPAQSDAMQTTSSPQGVTSSTGVAEPTTTKRDGSGLPLRGVNVFLMVVVGFQPTPSRSRRQAPEKSVHAAR